MIRHLVSGAENEAHSTLAKYYTDYQLNITKEILEFVAGQGMAMAVKEVVDHHYNEDRKRWELKISWAGLQSIEDSSESADDMLKDVPNIVKAYVDASGSELLQQHIG
ncbi:hypothetical protein PI124_g10160 [Phytophthora idaei]|nr:hypothetical protein PI125_g7773 [Phytophthora idaei]KAG3155096.1 hypothetical protein PI126_g9322 [Phytophthora idaei]KAG3245088.1 hypothetical protein PI124_g10160 [Phytophthora idaei]